MDRPRGGGISKRGRGKYPNKNIHIVLPDDDLDMDRRSEQAGRARPPSYRGRGSRGDRGRMRYTGGPGRGITVGESSGVFSWHKVVLKNGTKYDKIVLLKELLARTETKFIPICYSKQGVNTQFYLEDGAAARALKDLDKKLEMPDGFPLAITVDRTSPPNMPISDELVEKIKVVMSKRYFVANKALNLSAFHVGNFLELLLFSLNSIINDFIPIARRGFRGRVLLRAPLENKYYEQGIDGDSRQYSRGNKQINQKLHSTL